MTFSSIPYHSLSFFCKTYVIQTYSFNAKLLSQPNYLPFFYKVLLWNPTVQNVKSPCKNKFNKRDSIHRPYQIPDNVVSFHCHKWENDLSVTVSLSLRISYVKHINEISLVICTVYHFSRRQESHFYR